MPYAAFVCRLTAWFVLGAGAAGAVFFLRYDGLGVAVAAFLVVLAVALAVLLWAVGRVCAETARLAKRLAPPAPERTAWRPWVRRRDAISAAAPPPEATAREMTPDELADFFGRPESLAAHRAAQPPGRRSQRRG